MLSLTMEEEEEEEECEGWLSLWPARPHALPHTRTHARTRHISHTLRVDLNMSAY